MTTTSKSKTQYAPNPAILGGQPRYVQLAQTLLNEIESGRYPVGAQLPTEFELCEQFGVSRSTAREAVKRLVSLGLVVRQPRVGSTVCARTATTGYRQSMAEVSDLYQYATETTLFIESSEMVEMNPLQAQLVEGDAGETWLHLRGRRHVPASQEPICVTELWIHPAFRSVKGLKGALSGAVHAAIEKQFGEVITSVEQEIRATLLTDAQADALQTERQSAGLWVCRKYRNKLNQLVELAISIHPADRFSYSTVLRREWGVGAVKPGVK